MSVFGLVLVDVIVLAVCNVVIIETCYACLSFTFITFNKNLSG